MNIVGFWWHRICEPLDGFLWHRDISHPIVRPVLRNEILASGLCLLCGGAIYFVFPWLFWFGCGLLCLTWIFWSWAKFFLRHSFTEFGSSFLGAVILRFLVRLAILAILLYLSLAICHAPASAILAGMICGAGLALAGYALNMGGR